MLGGKQTPPPSAPGADLQSSRAAFRGSDGSAVPTVSIDEEALAAAVARRVAASAASSSLSAASIADAVHRKLQPDLRRSAAAAPVAAPAAGGAAAAAAAAPASAPGPAAGSSGSRDVVMGLAKGIDFQNLYQFVRSLRQASPSVDIVIFTDDVPTEHQDIYSTYRVTLAKYSEASLPAFARKYHPSSYRWLLIRDYLHNLESSGSQYDRVMFTDVRDTVFQRDPFVGVSAPGFYAFLEAKPGTIKKCGWNSGWVKDCFGAGVLSQIGNNIISCSGTSQATWAHAVQYADLMAGQLESTKGRQCERNGVDQGMHNVFVYQNQISDLHIVTNEDGWITTVQSMRTLTRNPFGEIMNDKGEVSSVVHQWDRSPELTRQYQSQFVTIPANRRNRK